MAASMQELTAQVVALTDQLQAQTGSRGGDGSVFDKKRL
jgi:hypothetical protein